jgi:lipoate-protein ligase A
MVRLLIDPPADGPTNMARDEALLQCVGKGQSAPALRFYRWSPATISLGYFQKYDDYCALPPPAGQLAVVRRQTGGGAILHDRELTYSLTLPLDHPLLQGTNANSLYERVHRSVRKLIDRFDVPVQPGPADGRCKSHGGPFFCFEQHSSFDLLINGKKLLGSAQRRTHQAVLQHGSLILTSRYSQQCCSPLFDYVTLDIDEHIMELARLILGDNALIEHAEDLEPAELSLSRQLFAKYADHEWTRKR